MKRKLLGAALCVAAAASMAMPSTASAAKPAGDPSQQLTPVLVESHAEVVPAPPVGNAQHVLAATAASTCWGEYVKYDWKNALGQTMYWASQSLEWCGNGATVTSKSLVGRGLGATGLGWSTVGDDRKGSINVGWEVRQYTQEKFHFSEGPYNYDRDVCVQIRGGASGLWSSRASCDLG